jgi:hypothetical protein
VNRKKLSLWLILSIIGGFLYRAGGASWGNTKFRDAGVSAISCLLLVLLGGVHDLKQWLSLLPMFGLMWLALTTYRYFLPKPIRYGFPHYALHGFFVAFAAIPYAWATQHWLWFSIRCLVSAIGVGVWSHLISQDTVEEIGRGVIITGTIPLLLI